MQTMQKTKTKRLLLLLVCAVLIAAAALLTSGCNNAAPPDNQTLSPSEQSGASVTPTVLGTGATKFYFDVVDGEGNKAAFEINTDETVVGDALQQLGLIEGEEGPYGLYVKKVNSILADYDETGTYWAFYVNGEMAAAGVDSTEIVAGETYAFVVSK